MSKILLNEAIDNRCNIVTYTHVEGSYTAKLIACLEQSYKGCAVIDRLCNGEILITYDSAMRMSDEVCELIRTHTYLNPVKSKHHKGILYCNAVSESFRKMARKLAAECMDDDELLTELLLRRKEIRDGN